MVSVHHKHALRVQRQSIKAKFNDDLENKLSLCHVLPNKTRGCSNTSLALTPSSRESILRHKIPSPILDFDHEMSRWTQHQSYPTMSSGSESLVSIGVLRPMSETRTHDQNHSICGIHQERIANRSMKGPNQRIVRERPSRPPPLDLERPTSITTSAQRLRTPIDVDSEINRVKLEDFHFNFESPTESEQDMQSFRSSHSTLPSLSYSIRSSPPATPTMYSDSLSPGSTDADNGPSLYNKQLPLTPPSSPPQQLPPPSSPTPSVITAIQHRRSTDASPVHIERCMYRPFPACPAPSTPQKGNAPSAPVETSFIDWDDSPSRFAKMKKSIYDLRSANNSAAATSKNRKNIDNRLTAAPAQAIAEPSITSAKTSRLDRMKGFFGKVGVKRDDSQQDQQSLR